MGDDIQRIVIVGGGLAAAKAVETVRDAGFDGALTLITEEPERPYERPPLSKGVLIGEQPVAEVYVHEPDFYRDHDIDVVVDDAAVEVDRGAARVTTASGRRLAFDRLLLATGARPRTLPLGDGDLDGITTLRTLADSRRLSDELSRAEHVTVVGAGWIGCEVAAAARTRGVAVSMVDPLSVPLERVLGREVGAIFGQLHADHGVDLRLGVGVSGASGGDRVEQVRLTDGTTIDTDLVVVGIGVVPRTELAEMAGLDVADGIVVDETLASSDPRILAAGDVAETWHPVFERHVRVEHWANALNQGTTAGRNLLGAAQVYDRLPYFYTDQYDLGMEYVGDAPDWDRVVLRGDPSTREFLAFWLRDRRVVAAMNVNIWDVTDGFKALITSQRQVEPAVLADPAGRLQAVATADGGWWVGHLRC
jgi:3-phenylpropionate/trans-cinnamate dioxygenase ferredoxin reductase component